MIKQITIKIFSLVIVFVVLNFVYQFTVFKKDLKEISPCAYQCANLKSEDKYIYLGESSNFTADGDDSTQLSISELTAHFSNKKIITIDTPAVHAGIYKYWIYQIKKNKPKAIIVTMNLRSFGADWINSKLETVLNRGIRILHPQPKIWNRFLISLKNFNELTVDERAELTQHEWKTKQLIFPYQFKYKTVREWDSTIGNGGFLKQDGSWDMDKIKLATHFVKNFAFNIDEHNPRVQDFDNIVDWGEKNKVKIYLNLLAENIKLADSLVGKDLVFLMKQNRDFLINRYTKKGATVIDNLDKIEIINFLDKNWPTEHYNYKGRIIIAKNIAKKLE